MVTKHCVYLDCESDSRYWDRDFMRGVCFIRFPNPVTHRDRCLRWVKACGRSDLTIESVTDKTFICSKHFLGGNGPTVESADPLPPQQLLEANRLIPQLPSTESELITTLLSKNPSLMVSDNKSDNLSLFKLNESLSTNQRLISSKARNDNKNEENCIDLDMSDNSIDLNNELINDSLTMPTTSSASPQMTTQMMASDKRTSDKKNSEVINGSLPLIIIPSNNHVIGSSFSVPMSLNDDKTWFKKLIASEFHSKLFHSGLHFGGTDKRVKLSQIEGAVVAKQLIVDISGHFDVKVFGLSISAKNDFYKSVPIFIQNESEFNSVLALFAKWKVCVANEIPELVLDDRIITIRTFICNTSNTLRTRNCDLFLPEVSPIRCKSCRILLNRIRKLNHHNQNHTQDGNHDHNPDQDQDHTHLYSESND